MINESPTKPSASIPGSFEHEIQGGPINTNSSAPRNSTGTGDRHAVDVVESTQDEMAPGLAAAAVRYRYNNIHISMNGPDSVLEAQTMQVPHPEDPKNCRARNWRRSILRLLMVVGALVIVVRALSVPPSATELEQIACDFIGHPSLTDCRTTLDVKLVSLKRSTIPTEIGLLTQLTALDCAGPFRGTIPSSISQLTRLTFLRFAWSTITGTIPSSISQLTMLNVLDLFLNELKGTIPSSISNLTRLAHFGAANNHLSGTIPPSIYQLTMLTVLTFHINHLKGTIPSAISQLTLLTHLDFASNYLKGTVPSSISQLTLLTYLSFHDNPQLTGSIPSSIADLTRLTGLGSAATS